MCPFKKSYFLLLIPALLSCQKLIEVEEQEYNPQLVMNCILKQTRFQWNWVELYESKDILDSAREFRPVSGASVLLYENEQLVDTCEEINQGIYSLNYKVLEGKTYKITAEANGFESIVAEDRIPDGIQNLKIETITPEPSGNLYEEYTYRLTYSIDDPIGPNFYDLELEVFYGGENGGRYSGIDFWEVGTNLDPFDKKDTVRVFSDALFDGQTHERTIEFTYSNEDRYVSEQIAFILTLRHVSQAYYQYFTSLENQAISHENPFAEPALVYSNVNNGIGILASYSTVTTSYRVK